MTAPTIQLQPDNLKRVAHAFDEKHDSIRVLYQKHCDALEILKAGAWEAESADVFYQNMEKDILPGLHRLMGALSQASETTLRILQIMEEAESLAESMMQGGGNAQEAFTKARFDTYAKRAESTAYKLYGRQLQLINQFAIQNRHVIDPENKSENFIPDILANIARRTDPSELETAPPPYDGYFTAFNERFGPIWDRGQLHLEQELRPAFRDEIRKRIVNPATGQLYPDFRERLQNIRFAHDNFLNHAVIPGFRQLNNEGLITGTGAYGATVPGAFVASVPQTATRIREEVIREILNEHGVPRHVF